MLMGALQFSVFLKESCLYEKLTHLARTDARLGNFMISLKACDLKLPQQVFSSQTYESLNILTAYSFQAFGKKAVKF